MKYIILALFLFGLDATVCNGQVTDTVTLYARIDSTINIYKNSLLSRKTTLIEKARELQSYAADYNLNAEQSSKLNSCIDSLENYFLRKTLIYDVRDIKNKDFQESGWSFEYGKIEANIFGINRILRSMISKNIVKKEPPYELSGRRKFHEHIAFFDISDGQVILDVGGGSGIFSLVIGMMYEHMIIGYNESDKRAMKYMQHECEVNTLIKKSNTLEFYNGRRRSTLAEHQQFDKILLVYTFHHFKKKKDMLRSIAKSMKNGSLYISEPIKSDEYKTCKKAVSLDKIYSHLSKEHFKILDEVRLDRNVMLKCVVGD